MRKLEIRNSKIVVGLLAYGFWLLIPSLLHANRLLTYGAEENSAASVWTTINGSPTTSTTTVYSGTYSARFQRGATAGTDFFQSSQAAGITTGSYSARFRFYLVDAPDTLPARLSCFGNSADADGSGVIQIRIITGPKLQIFNRITSGTADGTTTLSTAQWYTITYTSTLGDTTGSVELKLNGNVEASMTNVDTLDGANGFRRFVLGQGTSSANYDFFTDDAAWNDSQGTFETGYPTLDGRIALMKPASDQTVTWTKTGANCSATTNTDCVDDMPGTPDDASGYNMSAVANNEDRLNSTTLPAEVPSDADMILLDVYDRWDGNGTTGTRQGRLLLWDEASAQTNGPTHSRCDVVAGTWSIAASNQHLVFDLGTRTKANVESFDLGYEPLNANECRVTAIWANVEWQAAPPAPSCTASIALLGVGCR